MNVTGVQTCALPIYSPVLQPPLFRHGPERREDREQAEQENRPGAERGGRPALEHDLREILRLEQHVPEAQRPPQINREQRPAHDRADRRDAIARPDHRAVVGSAEPLQQRRQEIRGTGEPAHEKVGNDEPGPVGRTREERVGHQLGPPPPPPGPPMSSMRRLRKPTNASTPNTAALATERPALLRRFCVGSSGWRGRPYTSGLSTSR